MVRTSRNGAPPASMDALDNIDLDDMFADDGDALFDGLDIDLDMDDLGGSSDFNLGGSNAMMMMTSSSTNTSATMTKTTTKKSSTGPSTRKSMPPPPPGEDGSTSRTTAGSATGTGRRKTKRKAKTLAYLEEDDDEVYSNNIRDAAPTQKKRKATKAPPPTTVTTASAASKKKGATSLSLKPPTGTKLTSSSSSTSISTSGITKSKSKSGAKVSTALMPPPPQVLARGGQSTSSGSIVAAAGQFGGRNKRGSSSFALPKSTAASTTSNNNIHNKNKLPFARSVSDSNPATHKLGGRVSSSSSQQSMSRPTLPQNTYCSLSPSNTLFYPFMPALPTDLTIKSRKVYPAIDRIHSSFATNILSQTNATTSGPVAKETDAIFHLLQEAFKEEKPIGTANQQPKNKNRSEVVGNAIGALRKTITGFDSNRLITDWFTVCGLLQRQHDFLKQNGENMERWCRDHFSGEDYASVYMPHSISARSDATAKISILKYFTTRELKVKLLCNGYKDPKMSGPLRATLPQHFRMDDITDTLTAKPVSKSKKRKLATPSISMMIVSAKSATDPHSSSGTFKSKQSSVHQSLSYVNMKPARRRKNVAEMLARTARELENGHMTKLDILQRSVDRHESDLQKFVDQDNITGIHTTCMWKWLELAGFFNNVSEGVLAQLQEELRPQNVKNAATILGMTRLSTRSPAVRGEGSDERKRDDSLWERLQSLLVEEGDHDGVHDDAFHENLSMMDLNEYFASDVIVDLSQLTLDERAFFHLQKCGLEKEPNRHILIRDSVVDKSTFVETGTLSSGTITDTNSADGGKDPVETAEEDGTLDNAINAMTYELMQLDGVNNRRVEFLMTLSSSTGSAEDQKRKNEQESSLITKCQQLIRRSKEMKPKSGAMTKKDDSFALPW